MGNSRCSYRLLTTTMLTIISVFVMRYGVAAASEQDTQNACHMPFVFDGKNRYECLYDDEERWWCATTADFDEDQRWRECPRTAHTFGGNTPGVDCVFPFIYHGRPYSHCHYYKGDDYADGVWWCGTSTDYDSDKLWTRCDKRSVDLLPCEFSGTGDDEGAACVRIDGEDDDWTCLTASGMRKQCPDTATTEAGNDPGKSCVFPFYYKKTEYQRCILHPNGYRWCATTGDYDADGQWTHCKPARARGRLEGIVLVFVVVGGVIGGVCVLACLAHYCSCPGHLAGALFSRRGRRARNKRDTHSSTHSDDWQQASPANQHRQHHRRRTNAGEDELSLSTVANGAERCTAKPIPHRDGVHQRDTAVHRRNSDAPDKEHPVVPSAPPAPSAPLMPPAYDDVMNDAGGTFATISSPSHSDMAIIPVANASALHSATFVVMDLRHPATVVLNSTP